MQAPLIVTDPGLAALPMIEAARAQCRDSGLNVGVFSAIKGNPTGDNVMAGVAAFKAGGHDGVIAFGGGSALDAGKAIALMVGQDRPLWDFEDIGDNCNRVNVAGMAPVVAVPTTAGTGSEVGRAIIDTFGEFKIDKLQPGSGAYELDVSSSVGKVASAFGLAADSVYLGVLELV